MRPYDVRAYQIEGPAWIDSQEYDVTAKIPQGASGETVRVMLQALLAERFAVQLHKETRTLLAYEMSVAKAGPKLQEVDTQAGIKASLSATSPMIQGQLTVSELARYLSNMLNRRVIDASGLQARYDISLPFDPTRGMSGSRVVIVPDGPEPPSDSGDAIAKLFQALKAFGLKLDPKKSPTEVIVIDSANRVPTEN
jgi:uncharacterized protein (TIGR03435 family)